MDAPILREVYNGAVGNGCRLIPGEKLLYPDVTSLQFTRTKRSERQRRCQSIGRIGWANSLWRGSVG
jgi:hypothetical protein